LIAGADLREQRKNHERGARAVGRDIGRELPPGLVYTPEFISPAEEQAVLESLKALPYADVKMRGQVARRRTVHFGWLYGYESARIAPGPLIPDFLLPLRKRAASLGGVPAERLVEVLITRYPTGAGIGWHRDAPMFDTVVGVSLLGECRMRFRPRDWRRAPAERRALPAITLAPRSAYVLDGAVRWDWDHSIPPSRAPRYSVTYRSLKQ
jgi:alkylated DNA repair dioxygenase AlkB